MVAKRAGAAAESRDVIPLGIGGLLSERTVRGAKLEVRELGGGEPLVLVHGSVSDMRTWSGVADEFAEKFRVVSYSRRFHWPNEPILGGADYSMDEQVDDLEALLSQVAPGPVHVVGHSYGAYLALLATLRSPERVKALVLAEPPVLPLFVSIPPKPVELLKLVLRRPALALSIIRFGAKGIEPATKAVQRGAKEEAIRLFGTAVLGQEAYGQLSDERMAQIRANFIEAEFLGSGFSDLSEDAVAGVLQPTLLLGGEDSPPLFGHLLDRLEELLPNVERAEIGASSHNVHEDNPREFVDRVSRFLCSNSGTLGRTSNRLS